MKSHQYVFAQAVAFVLCSHFVLLCAAFLWDSLSHDFSSQTKNEKIISQLRREVGQLDDTIGYVESLNDRLRAENDRLRAENTRMRSEFAINIRRPIESIEAEMEYRERMQHCWDECRKENRVCSQWYPDRDDDH